MQYSKALDIGQITETFFQEALQAHLAEYRAQFGDRLIAVYVWGSVYRNEAVPGVSDLDLEVFVNNPLTEADEAWYSRTREVLAQSYPGTNALVRPRVVETILQGLHPNATEGERMLTQAYTFRLSFDAAHVFGRDLLQGVSPPVLPLSWVQASLESIRDLVRYTAGLEKVDRSDFDLPHDDALRLRKLARLSVLGGAHLLMAHGGFTSYRGSVVLPALQHQYPEWDSFLEETATLYIYPLSTPEQRLSVYLPLLVDWVEWIANQIKETPE